MYNVYKCVGNVLQSDDMYNETCMEIANLYMGGEDGGPYTFAGYLR